MKIKLIIVFAALLFCSIIYAQQGTVSGTLLDDTGLPLPGVNIIVKGTSSGTQTDFDGNYSIDCKVGDTLLYAYVGFTNSEVQVTPEMFGESIKKTIKQVPVQSIKSDAYAKALKEKEKTEYYVPSFGDSKRTFNKNNTYFQSARIKNIDIKKDKVKLTYFSPDLYYEVGYYSRFGVQFVKNKNLPELQNTFSQGLPVENQITFQGAETGNPFSYGPALNTLVFDGNNYGYDTNGLLISQSEGNGAPAKAYDNSIFQNVLHTSNKVFVNISSDLELFGVDFLNENSKDIFDRERRNNNRIKLNYKRNKQDNKLGWKSIISYRNREDNQPNINGFQNNLLLNLWATPPSFSNRQGAVLSNNTQRSFNTLFNNPEWLLIYNGNSIRDQFFVSSIQNDIDFDEKFTLESKLNYTKSNQQQDFGVLRGTAGFNAGFKSDKEIKNQNFNAVLNFNYDNKEEYNSDNKIDIIYIANYNYEDLNFSLRQANGFDFFSFDNPQEKSTIKTYKSRNTLTLLNQVSYEIDDILEFKMTNNSYFSSIQNNKWLLPSLNVKVDIKDLFNWYGINHLSFFSAASYDVNPMSLYYNNGSHNSLLLSPSESLRYTSNNDLFINPSISLEEKENYELSASFGIYLLGGVTNLGITYYNATTKGSVFPILNNNIFQLDNVADLRDQGLELSLDTGVRIGNDFYFNSTFSFSTYKSKVLKIVDEQERIPIAGFSTVSKNLIVGQPAGVIVGSAYARDNQNNIIIGDDGFPLVAENSKIIGDPVPNYNIGISNNFKWRDLHLNVVIDMQKGGDIWNGTQNVLNYLGTSQQSSEERGITNFVFDGVNQQGNSNTIPVDFYNPNNPITENRFVRYGFEGVAEDAIVDASYVNIKSIDISYSIIDRPDKEQFLRECKIGLYAENIFTWSKFRGNTPYNSLYGNASGQQLNFFNLPLQSEVGLNLKLKI